MRTIPAGVTVTRQGSPSNGKMLPSSHAGPRGFLFFHSFSFVTIQSALFCSTDSTHCMVSLTGMRTVKPLRSILIPIVRLLQRMRVYVTSRPFRWIRRSSPAFSPFSFWVLVKAFFMLTLFMRCLNGAIRRPRQCGSSPLRSRLRLWY